MPPLNVVRRKAFRAALAIDDSTVTKWAKANKVSYTHITCVLRASRRSRRVENMLDAYIATTLIPFSRTVLSTLRERQHAA